MERTVSVLKSLYFHLQLTTYWLPLVRNSLGDEHRTPIILVGNKVDLADYPTLEVRILKKSRYVSMVYMETVYVFCCDFKI